MKTTIIICPKCRTENSYQPEELDFTENNAQIRCKKCGKIYKKETLMRQCRENTVNYAEKILTDIRNRTIH
ncbi:hypothetical protein LLQ46_23145 [Rouxiella badensis]|uniref:ECs_2282 family putative zinc-binding protein n=1 Tax=Rouxiella badensis TaxID=1646377 RepID=UPI001B4ACB6D|nr:hypothetical protein [Rouxiella badensis]MCC3749754.1 hypothetical protein [Rouxiella badensis]